MANEDLTAALLAAVYVVGLPLTFNGFGFFLTEGNLSRLKRLRGEQATSQYAQGLLNDFGKFSLPIKALMYGVKISAQRYV